MNKALFENVCRIAAVVLNVPPESLSPESSPDSIESWDSLKHVNFIIALEQEFDVVFLSEEIANMLSIENVMKVIEKKTA